MQTIIIILDAKKLSNPDLDLRYLLPEEIEKISQGSILDNGYDYLNNDCIGIWLKAESALEQYPIIVDLVTCRQFLNNDLSLAAEIWISEEDTAEIENARIVYKNA